jgi:predicted aspartyl protease
MMLLAALLAAGLVAPAPVAASAAAQEAAGTATLRLRLPDPAERRWVIVETTDRYILFPATINGRAATVLLDNGADRTLIDRRAAPRLAVTMRDRGPAAVTSAMTMIETVATDAVTIEAPRAFRVEGPMVAADLSPIARALGRPVDVVLGRDVLGEVAVMIDPAAKRMAFHTGGSARAEAGTISVPVDDAAMVSATLNGKPVRLKLDLGFNGVVRLSDTAWRRVVPAGASTGTGSQTTADGRTRTTRTAFAALRVAAADVPRAPVLNGYVPAGNADGLLGNGFLSRGPIILDLKGRQLLLLPPQRPAAKRAANP